MCLFFFFFFNDTATTEIYTLSLHDALPIFLACVLGAFRGSLPAAEKPDVLVILTDQWSPRRSEEHTSELQSRLHLVCRLLLEKKKKPQLRYPQRRTYVLLQQQIFDRTGVRR